jgi:hypothetical protein
VSAPKAQKNEGMTRSPLFPARPQMESRCGVSSWAWRYLLGDVSARNAENQQFCSPWSTFLSAR